MVEVDVLIVGAGISGICAAHALGAACPELRYTIVEARDRLGGTWDLFRYPGIRSDSDMYTLGYSFRPWRDPKAIADGPSILAYLDETARETGIADHIRYDRRVESVAWSSVDGRWTVTTRRSTGETETLRCWFLWVCAGYFRYDRGHTPDIPGLASFGGRVVHPQHWPQDLEVAGKRVVLIGSGATAVTLAPELAKAGAAVTVVQRSPTYVVQRPSQDAFKLGNPDEFGPGHRLPPSALSTLAT
ncbi:MAG: NAD(P)/FAD-dependent oxidoreductase, partial [Myxococcota bacterium]